MTENNGVRDGFDDVTQKPAPAADKRIRIIMTTSLSSALQGMQAAESSLNTTAGQLAQSTVSPLGGSGGSGGDTVSLSDAMVSLLNAKDSYQINVNSAEVSDQMTQATINMMG